MFGDFRTLSFINAIPEGGRGAFAAVSQTHSLAASQTHSLAASQTHSLAASQTYSLAVSVIHLMVN